VGTSTLLAEDEVGLAGFMHVVFDDRRWGSLVDNLHVRNSLRRTGIGTRLLQEAARAVVDRAAGPAVYLWVLEQNRSAQDFYRARGGRQVERVLCRPAGIAMSGTPYKLRMSWPNAATLLAGD
jgi:ribosomal protein S18 acetylase RimI-like enzyme